MDQLLIAVDVDGTLYDGEAVPAETEAALRACRDHGDLLVIVTGRRWETLPEVVPSVLELFHCVIAEEGGVIVDVASGAVQLLAPRVEPDLLAALRGAGVTELDIGHVVVGAPVEHFAAFASARDTVGSTRHLVVNKLSVALAPRGFNKASGLRAAVDRLSAHGVPVVAIGDAANDLPMFAAATHPYAVANSDRAVYDSGVPITQAKAGYGVAEVLRLYRPT